MTTDKIVSIIKSMGIFIEDEHFDIAREVILECARIASKTDTPSQDILKHFGL